MARFVLVVLALVLVISTASVVNGQCATYCVANGAILGCCPATHPWCCVLSGALRCCRFNNNAASMFLRPAQMNQNTEIDSVERLELPPHSAVKNS